MFNDGRSEIRPSPEKSVAVSEQFCYKIQIDYRSGSAALLACSSDRARAYRLPFRQFDATPCPGRATSCTRKVTIMTTGTVKWFNSAKGFGFIQPDAGGADVFVHISAVERSSLGSIHEGQKLGYEVERDQRSGKSSAGQLQAA